MRECRGRAREQVGPTGRARLAGVQHNEPRRWLGLIEQVRERAGHEVRSPVLAYEGEQSLVSLGVERAVPDEVQHVPLPGEELGVDGVQDASSSHSR